MKKEIMMLGTIVSTLTLVSIIMYVLNGIGALIIGSFVVASLLSMGIAIYSSLRKIEIKQTSIEGRNNGNIC